MKMVNIGLKISPNLIAPLEIKWYICAMIGIYKITSPTGRVYIGQSISINKRILFYKRIDCKRQPRLLRSIKKHGWGNHEFEVLEQCLVDNLNERERHWQDYYNVLGKMGLNCVLTSTEYKDSVYSDSVRMKMSKAKEGVMKGVDHPMYGRKHTPEARLKIKEARAKQTIKHSQETKSKIGKSQLGRKLSKEQIEFISNNNKGRTPWNKGVKTGIEPGNKLTIDPIPIINMYNSGKSMEFIRKELSVSWDVVKRILTDNGIKTRSIKEQKLIKT